MNDPRLRRPRIASLALLFSSVCVFAAVPAVLEIPASAQQRGPVQRVVEGKVTDHANTALKGAVVYLKDDHTLSVKSYITSDQGTYRFGQLAQNTDYEIWAEHNNQKSSVKTISSFDNKNHFYIDLKINSEK